ncbi:MAG TPA: DUF2239 family protein [Ramlibacter sp.]|nr:DUF2239 family protein [Ramlibacter sp.]
MQPDPQPTYTAFLGPRRLASGTLAEVALALVRARERSSASEPLVFSDATGSQVDLDLRGSEAEVLARHRPAAAPAEAAAKARGRPRMGVVAREVTLLPEHWDWLAAQPGGASVVLRQLVHQARRAGAGRERMRRAQERSYKVMVALAGDRPGFEEAARALFAGDMERLRSLVEPWPRDVREHVLQLADPDHEPVAG